MGFSSILIKIFSLHIPFIYKHLFYKYFVHRSVGQATKGKRALLLMDVVILVLQYSLKSRGCFYETDKVLNMHMYQNKILYLLIQDDLASANIREETIKDDLLVVEIEEDNQKYRNLIR